MTFAAPFYGNAEVVQRLDRQLRRGRLSHAIVFTGPPGVGKRTCALRIAKALNCRDGGFLPCGACADCLKIDNATHADVRTLTLEEGASQIKIEQIRDLRASLEFEPLEGAARVYLIDPADRMTPAAANAILKSLEEPPPGTHFFLITANVGELLATIRSRSQAYHFSPVPLDEIREAGVVDELVLRWSQGSVGRALRADPKELRRNRDRVLDFLETVVEATGDSLVELLSASDDLAQSKEDYGEHIRILSVLISDLLFLTQAREHRVVNIDIRERLGRLQRNISLERIIQIGDCLRLIEANLKHHVNRRMMTDELAMATNRATSEILNDNVSDSG